MCHKYRDGGESDELGISICSVPQEEEEEEENQMKR